MESSGARPKCLKTEVACKHFYKRTASDETENVGYLDHRRTWSAKEKPKVEPLPEDDGLEESLAKTIIVNVKKEQSEYERLRLKNITEKAALLQSLGIEESKRILSENQNRPRKPRIVRPKEPLPLRAPSLRLRNKSPEHKRSYGEIPEHVKRDISSLKRVPKVEHHEEVKEETILRTLTMEESYFHTKEALSPFLEDLKQLSSDSNTEQSSVKRSDKSWCDSLYRMKITSDQVAKVTPGRICSVAVHPTSSRFLAVAGDKYGNVGFWDVDAKDEFDRVHVFKPHVSHVSCVAFATEQPEKMYTSSYDGTVRCTDLESFVFNEILQPEDPIAHGITFFDFVSSQTLCMVHGDGCLEVIDTRSRKKARLLYESSSRRMNTVSVHPVQRNYVMTADNEGNVNIWDLRYMTSKPKPCSKMQHYRCVDSAFFSPMTGNTVLTSSSDNYIRLYDVTDLSATHSPRTQILHDNCVGRCITNFRPIWVPGREDYFVVGCLKQPRRIELFETSGKIHMEFYGKKLLSVCSINAFHPTQNILVGGNSSGRVCVFK